MSVLAEKTPFVPGPVASAGAVPLSDSSSGQPVICEAIMDMFRPMLLGVVEAKPQDGAEDARDDGTVKETVRWLRTSGVIQPGKGEKLDILAGGERSWDSALLHTTPDFNVPTDARIRVKGKTFRIVVRADWSVNGYMRYELAEDYARSH